MLVSLALLPRIQMAVSTGWAPRDPEPLLAFLDAWEPLLPPDVYHHVLEALVFPKVRRPPARQCQRVLRVIAQSSAPSWPALS